jgi:hypothetical protein
VLEPAPVLEGPEPQDIALDCSASDPNLRPVDCITAEPKLQEESIILEDVGRSPVAKVTSIGNLLLTGKVMQRSTAVPQPGAFTVGYTNDDFQRVTTVWIDEVGNLHLRGVLVEENANLQPPSGSYTVINRRGLYLAYANPQTGDFFLRGNVVPYREDVR